MFPHRNKNVFLSFVGYMPQDPREYEHIQGVIEVDEVSCPHPVERAGVEGRSAEVGSSARLLAHPTRQRLEGLGFRVQGLGLRV